MRYKYIFHIILYVQYRWTNIPILGVFRHSLEFFFYTCIGFFMFEQKYRNYFIYIYISVYMLSIINFVCMCVFFSFIIGISYVSIRNILGLFFCFFFLDGWVVPFELAYISVFAIGSHCQKKRFNSNYIHVENGTTESALPSSSSESEFSESELSSEMPQFCIGFIVIVSAESSQSSCWSLEIWKMVYQTSM